MPTIKSPDHRQNPELLKQLISQVDDQIDLINSRLESCKKYTDEVDGGYQRHIDFNHWVDERRDKYETGMYPGYASIAFIKSVVDVFIESDAALQEKAIRTKCAPYCKELIVKVNAKGSITGQLLDVNTVCSVLEALGVLEVTTAKILKEEIEKLDSQFQEESNCESESDKETLVDRFYERNSDNPLVKMIFGKWDWILKEFPEDVNDQSFSNTFPSTSDLTENQGGSEAEDGEDDGDGDGNNDGDGESALQREEEGDGGENVEGEADDDDDDEDDDEAQSISKKEEDDDDQEEEENEEEGDDDQEDGDEDEDQALLKDDQEEEGEEEEDLEDGDDEEGGEVGDSIQEEDQEEDQEVEGSESYQKNNSEDEEGVDEENNDDDEEGEEQEEEDENNDDDDDDDDEDEDDDNQSDEKSTSSTATPAVTAPPQPPPQSLSSLIFQQVSSLIFSNDKKVEAKHALSEAETNEISSFNENSVDQNTVIHYHLLHIIF
jgi:hypothetical protein